MDKEKDEENTAAPPSPLIKNGGNANSKPKEPQTASGWSSAFKTFTSGLSKVGSFLKSLLAPVLGMGIGLLKRMGGQVGESVINRIPANLRKGVNDLVDQANEFLSKVKQKAKELATMLPDDPLAPKDNNETSERQLSSEGLAIQNLKNERNSIIDKLHPLQEQGLAKKDSLDKLQSQLNISTLALVETNKTLDVNNTTIANLQRQLGEEPDKPVIGYISTYQDSEIYGSQTQPALDQRQPKHIDRQDLTRLEIATNDLQMAEDEYKYEENMQEIVQAKTQEVEASITNIDHRLVNSKKIEASQNDKIEALRVRLAEKNQQEPNSPNAPTKYEPLPMEPELKDETPFPMTVANSTITANTNNVVDINAPKRASESQQDTPPSPTADNTESITTSTAPTPASTECTMNPS